MPDKISVIIPTYNCAKYLEESIESVLAQTGADFEVIVVDDGSTDNTSEVLSRYKTDARIKTTCQPNSGPGAARNSGINLSEGDYLCFLDADDVMEPGSLSSRVEALTAAPDIAMVFSDYTLKHDENDYIRGYLGHNHFIEYFKSALAPSTLGCTLFNNRFTELFYSFSPHPIWTGTVMLRKSVAASVGFFRTDISVGEDSDYWMRIVERHRFAYIDKATAVYNHYRSSLTKDTEKYCRERIRRLKSIPFTSTALATTFNRNISEAYCHLGYHHYRHNGRMRSAGCYLLGLRYNFRNVPCLKGLLANMLPPGLARNIKGLLAALR